MRILIVGGVAGGASAAARARRLSEEAEIVIFERGEYISFANCGLPYHIAGVIPERERLLVQTPGSMKKRFGIDVRIKTEALTIDRARKTLLVKDLATGAVSEEPYDFLILSPGAEPVRPSLPGMSPSKIVTLRNMADMDGINAKLDGGTVKKAVVIGAGYIGLEMTEALRRRNIEVTLVELKDQVMEPVDQEMAAFLHQELTLNGVAVRLSTAVKGVSEESGSLRVELSSGQPIVCDLAVLAVGVKPEAGLAKEAGLTIGQSGGIVVDERMRTSDPNIFAVGDAVEVSSFVSGTKAIIPLAGPANRQGRIAADAIFGKKAVYKNTQGTAICKVFGITVGMTGENEKQLTKRSARHEKIHIHPSNHASYYPGASPISMKLLFDPSEGKILGAQAVGRDGVDKRIDVIAVAMRAGMTAGDLKDLELCYAPPYGSAKDPVNYLGFVASNVMDGTCPVCHVEDVLAPRADQLILDVRTLEEVRLGKIPGARHIPIDELRRRLGELPKEKELLVYCKVGLRGYLACRILAQNGFKCRNLSGGYVTYEAQAGSYALGPSSGELKDDAGAESARAGGAGAAGVSKRIDARGLQCPGPIMQIKKSIDLLSAGESLEILASDPGFPRDVAAWCRGTGNELVELQSEANHVKAVIRKKEGVSAVMGPSNASQSKTIVVFSSDLDKVIASFVIANGAAAMGSDVTMFFTFWGLNALRRPESVAVKKNVVERMFAWMMPRGADKLSLSRMNMAGMGALMIKAIMKKKNVSSLPELIQSAKCSGVRLVACTMSMDLMGIKKEELIEGVEFGGVAMYLEQAQKGNVNLFV